MPVPRHSLQLILPLLFTFVASGTSPLKADFTPTYTRTTTPLIEAIKHQNQEQVRLLLERGADPNEKDGGGFSPLYTSLSPSSWHGAYEHLVRSLKNSTPREPFAYINEATVRVLLKHGARAVEPPESKSLPLLPLAIYNNAKLSTVQLLIDAGAPYKASHVQHGQPLLTAVEAGHVEIVRYLLQLGVDPNGAYEKLLPSHHRGNLAPLHIAAHLGNLEIARLLVAAGADIEVKAGPTFFWNIDYGGIYPGGQTPVMYSVQQDGNPVLPFLLSRGTRVDPGSGRAAASIYEAARFVAPKNAALLLKAGASVQSSNGKGPSPLYFALDENQTPITYHEITPPIMDSARAELVRLLIKAGSDPNLPSCNGQTPLGLAAKNGRREAVKLLMENGGDPYAGAGKYERFSPRENPRGEFASALLQLLADGNQERTLAQLRKSKEAVFPAQYEKALAAAQEEDAAIAQHLLAPPGGITGPRLPRMPDDGFALQQAALNGNLEVVRQLLKLGVPVDDGAWVAWGARSINRRSQDYPRNGGSGALQLAASRCHIELVQYLIKCGADVNAWNAEGQTALMSVAGSYGSTGIRLDDYVTNKPVNLPEERAAWTQWSLEREMATLKLLLASGARVDMRDKQMRSVLHFAAISAPPEVMKTLLAATKWTKPMLDWKDDSGHTALATIIKFGRRAGAQYALHNYLKTPNRPLNDPTAEIFSEKLRQAESKDLEVMSMLLNAGEDPTLHPYGVNTTVEFARQNGFERAAELLANWAKK